MCVGRILFANFAVMKYVIATFIMCMVCCVAWSQQYINSRLSEFEKLDAEHASEEKLVASGNRFLAQLYSDEFIDEPIQFDSVDTLRMNVYYWGAELMYDHQEYAEAVRLGTKAVPMFRDDDISDLHSDCCSILAIANVRLGRFNDAAVYAKQCYGIDVKVGDHYRIASSLNTLAAIYMSARQPELAEQYVMRGIDECGKIDNPGFMAILKGMASEVYHRQGRDSLSLEYADEALTIEQQLDRKGKIAIRQAQRASALIGLHRYDEALQALSDAIPQFRTDGNEQSLGIADIQMGHLLLARQQHGEAVGYLAEAIDIFGRHHDLYNESAAQKAMAEALRYENPSEALTHLERYNQLHDSIYDSETGLLLSQYHANYDVEQLQEALTRERAHNSHLYIYIAVALIVVVVLAILTYRSSLRRRRRMYRELGRRLKEAENNKSVSQADGGTPTGSEQESATPAVQGRDAASAFLLRITEVVNKEMESGDISVASIATALGLSPYQLRQQLDETVGMKPQEFIQGLRMQRACELFRTQPHLTINEVAYRCGYEDKSNFTRAFKRVFGQTPSEFFRATEE